MATYYILVNFDNETLHLKVFGGPENASIYQIHPTNQKYAVLGRLKECDIFIDGKNLSKRHCTFAFDSGHWVLWDGYQSQSSVNGTWLFL